MMESFEQKLETLKKSVVLISQEIDNECLRKNRQAYLVLHENCESLIKAMEVQECERLLHESEILGKFALTVNEFRTFEWRNKRLNVQMEKYMKKKGLDLVLPLLQMDIEYLSKYLIKITERILDSHEKPRDIDATRVKMFCTMELTNCYDDGYEKYSKIGLDLKMLHSFVKDVLMDLCSTIDGLENVFAEMELADMDNDDYVQSFIWISSDVESVLLKSLEEKTSEERRKYCIDHLRNLMSETVFFEDSVVLLYDIIFSFRSDLSFFESLRLSGNLNLLYKYDMELHYLNMTKIYIEDYKKNNKF